VDRTSYLFRCFQYPVAPVPTCIAVIFEEHSRVPPHPTVKTTSVHGPWRLGVQKILLNMLLSTLTHSVLHILSTYSETLQFWTVWTLHMKLLNIPVRKLGKFLVTLGNDCLNLEPGKIKLKCMKLNWLHCIECARLCVCSLNSFLSWQRKERLYLLKRAQIADNLIYLIPVCIFAKCFCNICLRHFRSALGKSIAIVLFFRLSVCKDTKWRATHRVFKRCDFEEFCYNLLIYYDFGPNSARIADILYEDLNSSLCYVERNLLNTYWSQRCIKQRLWEK
jgi:hypothetical protein